jgi:transposase
MGNGRRDHTELEELRRQLSAKDALLAEREEMLAVRTAELAAAKTGLIAKTLEPEKLKAQLTKLRRERFGANSERIEREIEQFELALEEVEAAKAEITTPTTSTGEAEGAGRAAGSGRLGSGKQEEAPPVAARAAAPRHRACAGGVCKVCGGTELRQVGESVTEVLEYIPGRFEVVRHVRPACSCRKCEAMVAGADARAPDPARHGGSELARAYRHLQVLRPSSALPAGRDLRPQRYRHRSRSARRSSTCASRA